MAENGASVKGKPFQIEWPITEQAHFCLVEVHSKGTWRRPSSVARREKELRALSAATGLNKISRSKAQQAAPDQCSHPVLDSLPSGEQAQDVTHIDGDLVEFRYEANKINTSSVVVSN